MTYTVIVCKDGEDLVFKGILFYLAEPGRVKMLRERWITIEGVEGLIIHKETPRQAESCQNKSDITRARAEFDHMRGLAFV